MAILDAVGASPHATADEIETAVRTAIGSVSHQAIYDGLAVLVEHDLVRRIQPSKSPARFETRVGDNHHHLVCRSCHAMIDIDCAVGHAPCLEPAETAGYEIDEAEVIYWGLCPACRGASA